MKSIVLSACLWDANEQSESFSQCYNSDWALKLYRMWHRHVTLPHQFVLFTNRRHKLPPEIEQVIVPDLGKNGYGDCVVPFQIDDPMIFTGLDTLIINNCDKLVRFCLEGNQLALPKHPFREWSINGVVLKPQGMTEIYTRWRGENDMDWMRTFPHVRIDDLWPDRVVSYKKTRGHINTHKARIIYFHGHPKMHEAMNDPIVRENWK